MRNCLLRTPQRVSDYVTDECRGCVAPFVQKISAETAACADGADEFADVVQARHGYQLSKASAERICRAAHDLQAPAAMPVGAPGVRPQNPSNGDGGTAI